MIHDLLKRSAPLLLAGVLLSGCAALGTEVAEDDPETEVPNVSMGRAIMEGLGAVPSRRTPIDYKPRAPLVVPPTTTALAAPQDPNALIARPDWPDDPDVATRRRLQEAARREAVRERGDPIAPSELMAERLPPSSQPRELPPSVAPDPARILRPSQLASPASLGGPESLYDEAGNPRRRALVEPPVEYLQPAPGAPVAIPPPPKKKTMFSWFW